MAVDKRAFRPMGFSDILDEAFDLYKTNFVLLVGIAAVLYVPLNILNGFSLTSTIEMFSLMMANPTNVSAWQPSAAGGNTAVQMLVWPLMLIGYPTVIGAFTYAISQRYMGEHATIKSSYSFVFQRFGMFLATAVVFFALAGLSYAVCGMGGVLIAAAIIGVSAIGGTGTMIFGTIVGALVALVGLAVGGLVILRLLLMFPVLVAEGKTFVDCLTRAWNLSKGYTWRIFGILFLTWLIVALIEGITVTPAVAGAVSLMHGGHDAAAGATMGAALAIMGTILAPVFSIVVILIYYDLRIRKEGFDLQMLAHDLAASGGVPVTDAPSAASTVQQRKVCPQCGREIGDYDETTVCDSCGVTLHSACRQEIGGCRTPGCPGNAAVSDRQS